MEYLSEAILQLKPEAHFSYNDNDYSTIKWDVLDGDAPTIAEIEAAIKSIKTNKQNEASQKVADKAALLSKLGITEDEARLLLS